MGKYKKKAKVYTSDQLRLAAEDVIKKRKSDRKASLDTGIGRQIIRNKVQELLGLRNPGIQGRKTVLSAQEERELVKIVKEMADCGFAATPKQILSIVNDFSEVNEIQNPRFNPAISPSKRKVKNRIWHPTRKWLYSFMERNKLSRKRTKGMHLGRFRNIKNPFLINGFYDLLENEIKGLNIEKRPECIWNLDESGFPMDPNNTETVSLRGQKVVKVMAGTGRENITVLAACNASGESMPPLIIYSSKAAALNSIPPEWIGDDGIALPGTWYGLSRNGWMTTEIFEDWFILFAEKTKRTRPLLLLLDGHISHLSINTCRKAAAENISILKLPSHTTSKLQPLDISVFGPLKKYWGEQMNNWIMSVGTPIKAMSKKQFVNNLALIWNKGLSPSNIRSGFEFVGIFPFNREKYDKSIFEPQLVQKYERWLALGKPEIMPPELDESENVPGDAAAMEQSENDREEYAQPPQPLDKDGKPRKGRWVWIDESVDSSDIQTLDTLADLSQPGPSRAAQVPSMIESSQQISVPSTQAGPSGS